MYIQARSALSLTHLWWFVPDPLHLTEPQAMLLTHEALLQSQMESYSSLPSQAVLKYSTPDPITHIPYQKQPLCPIFRVQPLSNVATLVARHNQSPVSR